MQMYFNSSLCMHRIAGLEEGTDRKWHIGAAASYSEKRNPNNCALVDQSKAGNDPCQKFG